MKKHIIYILLLFTLSTFIFISCRNISPPTRNDVRFSRNMIVTGYCECGECCSWRRNWLFQPVYATGKNAGKYKEVGMCADGTMAKIGTIAADTKLYPFGTKMYIPGYGYGVVHDRGGAIKGNHIDLFFNSHQAALNWGHKKMKVYILK